MSYETQVALRYLRSQRSSFLSVVTFMSALGVILGVTALTATVSVTGGFQKAYQDRVLGVYPHIMLYSNSSRFSEYREVMQAVEAVPGVTTVSPFVRQPLMIYAEGSRAMVIARGLEVADIRESQLADYVLEGSFDDLEWAPGTPEDEPPGIMLGAELARRLEAEVGMEVTLVSDLRGTGRDYGPVGMRPNHARYSVVGIFEVGYNDFDSVLAITDLQAMQAFANRGDLVTGIDVRVEDPFAAEAVSQEITGHLLANAYTALYWQEIHRNLFESLRIQKMWLSIIMTVIVIVACSNIVSTLVLMVTDKTKEIAILKSMGATKLGIMSIFIQQGVFIGALGTLLGLFGGWAVCQIILGIDYGLDPTVYKISTLAVDIRMDEFIYIAAVAMSVSLVATFYPSWRASRLSPVEGLRMD